MDEREALLILNAVAGIGNRGIRRLLERYGNATKILALSASALQDDSGLSANAAGNILTFPKDKFLKAEYNLMGKHRVRVILSSDEDYPELLRGIADAPVVLYARGELPLRDLLSVGIVGSRKASLYGITTAREFAARLAELGITVVSGMARGIDTAAHRGALMARGTTIAVLGCGLAQVYPPENKELFADIAGAGAVLSEFPMATDPFAFNFPRRNRVISGLSVGVIVVEAARRSGALITADFAMEQGREVFAVPGNIGKAASQGAHYLIQQGAKLVTCVEDVLEDLAPQIKSHLNTGKARSSGAADAVKRDLRKNDHGRNSDVASLSLSSEENMVFAQITDTPIYLDQLSVRCQTSLPLGPVLLKLELKSLIRQLPGKKFIRT